MPSEENYSLIEGDFKNFTIRRISKEDHPRVLEHMKNFYMKDEATCNALKVTEDPNQIREFFAISELVMDDDISFLVEDKDTKEIAAVRLTHRFVKDVEKFAHLETKSPIIVLFFELFGRLNKEANLFEKYGINEYAELFAASTNTKYRNQGLTKELYRRSLVFLKAEGFKLTKVFLTSPWTKAATKSLGFQELCSLSYDDVRDGNGDLAFPQPQPESVKGVVLSLKVHELK